MDILEKVKKKSKLLLISGGLTLASTGMTSCQVFGEIFPPSHPCESRHYYSSGTSTYLVDKDECFEYNQYVFHRFGSKGIPDNISESSVIRDFRNNRGRVKENINRRIEEIREKNDGKARRAYEERWIKVKTIHGPH